MDKINVWLFIALFLLLAVSVEITERKLDALEKRVSIIETKLDMMDHYLK